MLFLCWFLIVIKVKLLQENEPRFRKEEKEKIKWNNPFAGLCFLLVRWAWTNYFLRFELSTDQTVAFEETAVKIVDSILSIEVSVARYTHEPYSREISAPLVSNVFLFHFFLIQSLGIFFQVFCQYSFTFDKLAVYRLFKTQMVLALNLFNANFGYSQAKF